MRWSPITARGGWVRRHDRASYERRTLPPVERVTGIGGFFFRARDPGGLAVWYQERFGITTVPESYDQEPWRQQEGRRCSRPSPRTRR